MDESHSWRQMFERNGGARPRVPERGSPNISAGRPQPSAIGGLDDGFQPSAHTAHTPAAGATLPLSEITDEAAMALAEDANEYRPWVLQRGARPVLMLHLRRHDPKSGLWMGWEISYPHLVAVEYTGDKLLSLDFGSRQFILEGTGLDELVLHLQNGNVLMVQEYAPSIWQKPAAEHCVSAIRRLNTTT
ncbi:hypothetical protein [Asticcacaulis benevestitus]|uniref:hypothetical protein n=1 Tax=Asticcacaulis benevestitus TaxID=347481 RepID=UPI000B2F24F4|nr:hypothetical protein [Asticcacaulis benevestitus]